MDIMNRYLLYALLKAERREFQYWGSIYLTEEEMEQINALNRNEKHDWY